MNPYSFDTWLDRKELHAHIFERAEHLKKIGIDAQEYYELVVEHPELVGVEPQELLTEWGPLRGIGSGIKQGLSNAFGNWQAKRALKGQIKQTDKAWDKLNKFGGDAQMIQDLGAHANDLRGQSSRAPGFWSGFKGGFGAGRQGAIDAHAQAQRDKYSSLGNQLLGRNPADTSTPVPPSGTGVSPGAMNPKAAGPSAFAPPPAAPAAAPAPAAGPGPAANPAAAPAAAAAARNMRGKTYGNLVNKYVGTLPKGQQAGALAVFNAAQPAERRVFADLINRLMQNAAGAP